jgi:hypothetical protein
MGPWGARCEDSRGHRRGLAFAVWALAGFALGVAAVAFGSPSINGVPDPPVRAIAAVGSGEAIFGPDIPSA